MSKAAMAQSVEATRSQLDSIEEQLLSLKKQATHENKAPIVSVLNAALDAVKSFDENVPLPIQNLLHHLDELSKTMKDDNAAQQLFSIRKQCVQLLVDMFVKNQEKIDKLAEGTKKLKEQYFSDFLQTKDQLAKNFHLQKNNPKPKGYFNILKFLDFLEPLRRAAFANALHAQTIKYFRQTQVADTSFNQAHLSEMMQLEIMQRLIHRTLMSEPAFNLNMLPATSQSYQYMMKELVGRYHGIIVGNLAIAEHSYESSRKWLSHMTAMMGQPLETYQLINEMDKYTQNEQKHFEKKSYKPSSQMLADKNATPEEFKHFKTFDEAFTKNLLTMLDNVYPPSAIIQFADGKGTSHSIGIAKDERGIWLHDAGRYCVYFPNKELGSTEAMINFQAFFIDYHQRNFQNLSQVNVVHIPQAKPAQTKVARKEREETVEREAPLLLGPGLQYSKQASFKLDKSQSTKEFAKPSLDPNRGPNKTGGF
ncbi:MAG: hypothetical protein AB7I18_11805 [Candidatus Berkiella sp.]